VTIIPVRTQLQITAGNPLLSTMFFGSDDTNAASAADAVFAFWQALSTVMSSECTFVIERECALIDPATGELTGFADSGDDRADSGSLTDELLPPATQGLITWKTSAIVEGRRLQGRTFIPGLPESQSSAGIPATALRTAADTAVTGLLELGPNALVVYSRAHHVADQVTSGQLWGEFAVLRSRRD
jgi:hypothetical protein